MKLPKLSGSFYKKTCQTRISDVQTHLLNLKSRDETHWSNSHVSSLTIGFSIQNGRVPTKPFKSSSGLCYIWMAICHWPIHRKLRLNWKLKLILIFSNSVERSIISQRDRRSSIVEHSIGSNLISISHRFPSDNLRVPYECKSPSEFTFS